MLAPPREPGWGNISPWTAQRRGMSELNNIQPAYPIQINNKAMHDLISCSLAIGQVQKEVGCVSPKHWSIFINSLEGIKAVVSWKSKGVVGQKHLILRMYSNKWPLPQSAELQWSPPTPQHHHDITAMLTQTTFDPMLRKHRWMRRISWDNNKGTTMSRENLRGGKCCRLAPKLQENLHGKDL